MRITTKYDLGQSVWLRTDPEQLERVVVAVTTFYGGSTSYTVTHNATESSHYEVELSGEKDTLKAVL